MNNEIIHVLSAEQAGIEPGFFMFSMQSNSTLPAQCSQTWRIPRWVVEAAEGEYHRLALRSTAGLDIKSPFRRDH